jgi:hypothetical protein
MPTPHYASGSSRARFAHGGVDPSDHTIRDPSVKKGAQSVESTTPRLALASAAIRCRFVDRFAKLKVFSRVSRQRFSSRGASLPSVGSRWVQFPACGRYYEGATTSRSRNPGRLLVSLPSTARSLQCSCSPHGAPRSVEDRPGPGHLFSRLPKVPTRSHVGMSGISQVPRRSVPYLCPAPRPRPDRRAHGHWRSHRCCPRSDDSEGSSKTNISRLMRGFGTCCLRFQTDVAVSPARLASGWLTRLCQEGVEPSGSQ